MFLDRAGGLVRRRSLLGSLGRGDLFGRDDRELATVDCLRPLTVDLRFDAFEVRGVCSSETSINQPECKAVNDERRILIKMSPTFVFFETIEIWDEGNPYGLMC